MKKIRLGLIGCGGMMKNHAKGIEVLDCVEITAVCDVDIEKAKDVASVLKSPYVTDDYKTMVDHVDAVLVVLPHHLHFSCGMFFARAKKHILMEKGLLEYDHFEGEIRLYDSLKEHIPGELIENGNTYKVIWKRESEVNKETQHEVAHFADCVVNDKKPVTDGRNALQSLRVIWKLYDAEKLGVMADLCGLGTEE